MIRAKLLLIVVECRLWVHLLLLLEDGFLRCVNLFLLCDLIRAHTCTDVPLGDLVYFFLGVGVDEEKLTSLLQLLPDFLGQQQGQTHLEVPQLLDDLENARLRGQLVPGDHQGPIPAVGAPDAAATGAPFRKCVTEQVSDARAPGRSEWLSLLDFDGFRLGESSREPRAQSTSLVLGQSVA